MPEGMTKMLAEQKKSSATFKNTNYQIRVKGDAAFTQFSQAFANTDGIHEYARETRYLEKMGGQWKIVTLFLAGDAVTLLRNAELEKVEGLGTGKLREHYDAIVKGGGRFFLSAMSSKARGITDADIQGKAAEFAPPTKLVQLAADSDRLFTY
jgi:predicted peroxiredoxin